MRDCELKDGQCIHCGWKWAGDPNVKRNCPSKPSSGPGTLLKKLTSAIGIKPCGGCEKRAAAMDAAWAKLTGK